MTRWVERPATAADYEAFLRYFAELGVDDPLPPAEQWLVEMAPATLFIESGGESVGYGFYRVLDGVGHIVHVVVDPRHRQRGAGAAVMTALARRLSHAGCARWYLNVKAGNEPAIRLYERFGLARSHAATSLVFPWEGIARLPREDAPVEVHPLDSALDGALEAAFDIPRGRLAQLRGRPEVVQRRLVDPARPGEARVGVGSFDPAFPGVYPLAVARPPLLSPLLSALRPYARPGDASVKLTIDRDAEATAALLAAGATVRLEIIQMRGEIP